MTAPGPAAPPPYPAPPGGNGTEPHGVPAPPAGPGVAPPFAAPPTEGRGVRMWLGLGAGALAVLLCCGGGTAALIGLAVAGTEAIDEQGRAVTGDYYRALTDDKYGEAYDLLCRSLKERESRPEFERRVTAEPEITSYRVGTVDLNELTVPVEVVLDGGGRETQQVTLSQNGSTGQLEICGVS
ncbi:hypothetical protein O7606_26850 [Micromonospora sp. WMMD882]|uniref:hypothetical protein n=1 Tax=Micromonospora sp. WMMD882 TaxID=3015151 RepID=UPI00248AE0B9|nr:hypothetical protein [Micromonospora sp. WMMD882]WBB79709.1 hypothetical protein O7606_26850 [Micromonospora sp. WMMD882]